MLSFRSHLVLRKNCFGVDGDLFQLSSGILNRIGSSPYYTTLTSDSGDGVASSSTSDATVVSTDSVPSGSSRRQLIAADSSQIDSAGRSKVGRIVNRTLAPGSADGQDRIRGRYKWWEGPPLILRFLDGRPAVLATKKQVEQKLQQIELGKQIVRFLREIDDIQEELMDTKTAEEQQIFHQEQMKPKRKGRTL